MELYQLNIHFHELFILGLIWFHLLWLCEIDFKDCLTQLRVNQRRVIFIYKYLHYVFFIIKIYTGFVMK